MHKPIFWETIANQLNQKYPLKTCHFHDGPHRWRLLIEECQHFNPRTYQTEQHKMVSVGIESTCCVLGFRPIARIGLFGQVRFAEAMDLIMGAAKENWKPLDNLL